VARPVGGSNKEAKKISACPVNRGKSRFEEWRG